MRHKLHVELLYASSILRQFSLELLFNMWSLSFKTQKKEWNDFFHGDLVYVFPSIHSDFDMTVLMHDMTQFMRQPASDLCTHASCLSYTFSLPLLLTTLKTVLPSATVMHRNVTDFSSCVDQGLIAVYNVTNTHNPCSQLCPPLSTLMRPWQWAGLCPQCLESFTSSGLVPTSSYDSRRLWSCLVFQQDLLLRHFFISRFA